MHGTFGPVRVLWFRCYNNNKWIYDLRIAGWGSMLCDGALTTRPCIQRAL
jgi:hypothetical protein